MENTIKKLVAIVKFNTPKDAQNSVSYSFKKLSPKASAVVVGDVQDYLEKRINRTELSLFLVHAGL